LGNFEELLLRVAGGVKGREAGRAAPSGGAEGLFGAVEGKTDRLGLGALTPNNSGARRPKSASGVAANAGC
jgi:hypothetical protein